ncbi:hypothetical protein ABEO87_15715 [Geobacillus stearothermophilus]|uniref:hypothetical protein n=1 Tax=Geobacillus stearothermophilus TaxID=1422 RepID=UPI003D222F56
MKKPFKVLSTAAILGAFAASSVVPSVVAAAEPAAAQTIEGVVVEKDGKNVHIKQKDYLNLKIAKHDFVKGLTPKYVKSSDGKYYLVKDYLNAKVSANGDIAKAFELLSQKPELAQNITPANAVIDENGNVKVEDEADLEVVEVSAINSTDLTVSLTLAEEVQASDLTGKKITLDNGSQKLTATFKTLNGKVAVFTIDQDIKGKAAYNGNYTVTGDWFISDKELVANYSAIINSTNVEGFIYSEGKPVVNAEVTVGGEKVKTDAYGYYKIPANAGKVTVSASKGSDYFVTETSANVTRNFSTVANFDLQKVEVAKLYVEGNVVDETTGKPVEGATVQLQVKKDGQWVTVPVKSESGLIYSITTDKDGKYSFGNSSSDAQYKLLDDPLAIGTEYRVVVSKDLSKDNLTNVYHAKTQTFTTSNKTPKTSVLTELTPVKEINKFELDLAWEDLQGTDNDADFKATGVKATLLNADGKEILVNEYIDLSAVKGANDTKLQNPIDLVSKSFFGENQAKPTLPTGTYFLKLEDVKSDGSPTTNAYAIIPVKVTEGTDYKGSATFQKGVSLNVEGKISTVKYEEALKGLENGKLTALDNDGNRTSKVINGVVNIYKPIEGVDVLVATLDKDQKGNLLAPFIYTVNDKEKYVSANVTVSKLTKEGYKVSFASPYTRGETSKSVSIEGALNNETLFFKSAGNLTVTTNVDGTVQLIDASGNVVAEKPTFQLKAEFGNIEPGKYKVKVTAPGYEDATSDSFTVLDFQDKEQTVTLKALEKPVVSGYVRFADDFKPVTNNNATDVEATVAVYDDVTNELVAYYDMTTGGTYEFGQGVLVEGKTYKFVVRGKGFETAAQKVTIQKGQNVVNFKVTRGGEGLAKLIIVDSKQRTLELAGRKVVLKVVLRDDNYTEKVASTVAGHDKGNPGAEFLGSYELTQDGKNFTSDIVLSKGDYSIFIPETAKTFEYKSTITIGDINATAYKVIDNVPTKDSDSGKLTLNISGKVYGQDLRGNEPDYVVAFDSKGNIVGTSAVVRKDFVGNSKNNTYTLQVPIDATYTIAVFANGHFVDSKVVTVQEFDKENVDFLVNEATRTN